MKLKINGFKSLVLVLLGLGLASAGWLSISEGQSAQNVASKSAREVSSALPTKKDQTCVSRPGYLPPLRVEVTRKDSTYYHLLEKIKESKRPPWYTRAWNHIRAFFQSINPFGGSSEKNSAQ